MWSRGRRFTEPKGWGTGWLVLGGFFVVLFWKDDGCCVGGFPASTECSHGERSSKTYNRYNNISGK